MVKRNGMNSICYRFHYTVLGSFLASSTAPTIAESNSTDAGRRANRRVDIVVVSANKPIPAGLSVWDQALLKALYATDQRDKSQLNEIKVALVHELAP